MMNGDSESVVEQAEKDDRLVDLEEAVDDGSVINTTGTLFLSALEAFNLPETERHGGLLGNGRQNMYVSVGLEVERGIEQQSSTSVQQGEGGAVRWNGETMSIRYSNAGGAVTLEVWNENPGSDVLIGKACTTRRHIRALVLVHDHCARIRLPLSRPRSNGHLETRGVITARIRLALDAETPQCTGDRGLEPLVASKGQPSAKEAILRENTEIPLGEASVGYIVCSGLTVYDLPPTEGLQYGGKQDPYVKLTLGSTSQRSGCVAGGGKLCEWVSQTLRWRFDSTHPEQVVWDCGLVVEVWNDNQPRPDTLIGKGFVSSETFKQLQRRPARDGVCCRVKLSRQGEGRKGTVSMVVKFELDQPGTEASLKENGLTASERALQWPESSKSVLITNMMATYLSDIMAFGFSSMDKVELYLVARVGATERAAPATAVVSGESTWADTCLSLPLVDMTPNATVLRLELWALNPVQDDQVGYVEADLTPLNVGQHEAQEGGTSSAAIHVQMPLELKMCLTDIRDEKNREICPGVLSCTVELLHKTRSGEGMEDSSKPFKQSHVETRPPEEGILLPIIEAMEGPGILKVTVLKMTLREAVEAPEIRLTLLPGKRYATTRPLLEIGGDSCHQGELETGVTGVWNQELDIPCYSMDFDALGATITLQADVIVAGVLAGQRVIGQGRAKISEAIQTRKPREVYLDITSQDRGSAPFMLGMLHVSVHFVGAWDSLQIERHPHSDNFAPSKSNVDYLHCPGLLRVFVIEARELSGLKPQQDPYIIVERMAADPTIAYQCKPFSSAVASVGAGREVRWLESFDLRVGQAEADFLRSQPGGGSIRFTVTVSDKDVRGGDESISSLEVVVTPETLSRRDSSVLWHRLFSQGRDRGFVRIGCCWIPTDLEPVNVCGLRPEERVEGGTLYLWLKEGRDLPNPGPTAPRIRGLPPTCEIELRPYAKVGRKKARGVLGCARIPESENPDLDSGVFHKFLKMDFAEVAPCEDREMAEASPTLIFSIYTILGGKRFVSGKAEILLASLCGYKNLNGEAVLRLPFHTRGAGNSLNNTTGRERGATARRGSVNRQLRGPDEVDKFRCPVAVVDKVIPLLEDGSSMSDDPHGNGRCIGSGGRGGELRLRALYVPDRLADALGVRSAIKALSKSAQVFLHAFTENPSKALSRAVEDVVNEGDCTQVLGTDTTALPGALEVYLIRVTDLQQIDGTVDPMVQLRLLCSSGGEGCTSEVGLRGETGVEWNRQFSLLVDDANLEMLEIIILDGNVPNGRKKPVACCKIPLRRYAQEYHSSQMLDVGQVPPERFRLTNHRGRGFRGHAILALNFLPEVVGQTHILQAAFAPTANFLPQPLTTITTKTTTTTNPRRPSIDATARAKSTISVLIVCMDGGDVSREDRVRVRVSLAGDSDDWSDSERFGQASSAAAVSGVGVVDEDAAVCRWDSPGEVLAEVDGEGASSVPVSGELLSLRWDPDLPLSAWSRGRASVLKFEVSRGPGRPAEWTGFVPTASLVHSPRFVFERAIRLSGRVGSEPPTSARTMASSSASVSAESANSPRGVSLEVAMAFHPNLSTDPAVGDATTSVTKEMTRPSAVSGRRESFFPAQSPFHPDLRRIPPEAGELVVHCLRARNLRMPSDKSEAQDFNPEVCLTAVPDGGEVATSTPYRGPGTRHPVWGQTRTLSVADAVTARVIVRVRNTNRRFGDNVIGEVELSIAGIIAAEHGMAAAVASKTASLPGDSLPGDEASRRTSMDGQNGVPVGMDANITGGNTRFGAGEVLDNRTAGGKSGERVPMISDRVRPCGVEAWFPLFIAGRQGGSRERERVGEIRLSCRFLSTDFMLQRELTAGADEGDNGPIGALRYKLERRPGRLFLSIRCCRGLPKAMIGERAPLVEARLRHAGWKCSTRRQVGLNPTFNENMAVEVMWTPQDLRSPELILEVKDTALGGGLLAGVRVAVAPFILHPFMPAEVWCPLLRPDEAKARIYCGMIYIPSPGGEGTSEPSRAIKSVENIADREFVAMLRQAWNGMLYVQVLSARGLPAASIDPQIGVRLRAGDADGPLPPFHRTAVMRGAGGEPRFNSKFLLVLRQEALGLEDQSERGFRGRTPVLEVEARCSRGRGKILGTVDIPIFPLWFNGHMTRVWYPMRSIDGESDAGRVFLELQFIADGGSTESSAMTASSTPNIAGRRRYLFLEVRQARDLRVVHALPGHPAVHLEMLGSGSKGNTPPAAIGGPDPVWPGGAGLLALPYPSRTRSAGSAGGLSEVLRITVLHEDDERTVDGRHRDNMGARGVNAGNRLVGQCDWPLPTKDLDAGRPISYWHALWAGGMPAGAVYLRCRMGREGETLDKVPPYDLRPCTSDGGSTMSRLGFGSYHVEFLKVRGFERTLRRMGLVPDDFQGAASRNLSGLQWNGGAYFAETPDSVGDGSIALGAASTLVGSGRAVAIGARGRGGTRPLCVQLSLSSGRLEHDGVDSAMKTLKAVSCVSRDKLVPIVRVPGSELLEWFPAVTRNDGSVLSGTAAGEADTGQVLLSIRYAPLAVGVLDVAVREAQLTYGSTSPAGNVRALSRILPPQTGGLLGQKVRCTPKRRGVRVDVHEDQTNLHGARMAYSWENTCPHRMKFNNAFNHQPAKLHISVVHGDRLLGIASVGVEAIAHDVISTMAREITEGSRKPRGSAHDIGPIGGRQDDFGDPVQAWYQLYAPTKSPRTTVADTGNSATIEDNLPPASPPVKAPIGRIRVEMKFAPHPKVLVKNWLEDAAVARASGMAAMKALYYRLNRSGSLVVDAEDLRLALAHAVEAFLSERAARARVENRKEQEPPRASQAGEFALLISRSIKSNRGLARGLPLSESTANSILDTMDRDRTAEVTFTEFCAFLSRAAAWQANAAVGELANELVEDNDDEFGDDDSEDEDPNAYRGESGGERGGKRTTCDTSSVPLVEPPQNDAEPSTKRKVTTGALEKVTPRREATVLSEQKAENIRAGKQSLPKDLTSWTVGHVQSWLSEDIQLPQYALNFREASVDGLVLCHLTDGLLKEGLSVLDPLHRLKILRHMQKLCKWHQQQPSRKKEKVRKAHVPHQDICTPRKSLIQPSQSEAVKVTASGDQDTREGRMRDVSIMKNGLTLKPDSSPLAVLHRERDETFGEPVARSSHSDEGSVQCLEMNPQKVRRETEFADKDGMLPVEPGMGYVTDGRAFTNADIEPKTSQGCCQSRTVILRSKKRRRKIPANATTEEVHKVVQTAMWEAAAFWGERSAALELERVNDLEDYPATWLGSSEGGSSIKTDRSIGGDVDGGSFDGGNGERASEHGGHREARVLFDKFLSIQEGGTNSPRTECGPKLTRHRLEVGIRSILQIEMRWEQWQLFLDSIDSLRTQGYLNLDHFSTAFELHNCVGRRSTPGRRSNHNKHEAGSVEFEADIVDGRGSPAGKNAGWGTTATADMAELRSFVLGIADALRASRPTLGDVISSFGRRGAGEVSVSEFMSLVSLLTGRRRYSTSAGDKVGGFDRKRAYTLLRCVDKDRDRRVALSDLVEFVFATWTEELNRLARGTSQADEIRQRRRQLQKDLRRHFPAKFRRALNLDEVKPDIIQYGPFSSLLTRLGLDAPSPPSPRSQPTFVSPRCTRSHSERDSSTDVTGDYVDFTPRSGSLGDVARQGGHGRKSSALSMPTQTQPPRHDWPANSDGPEGFWLTKTPARRQELDRRRGSLEARKLSLPPRVDLSAVTLTASHNRQLLAQGTFQTSGVANGV